MNLDEVISCVTGYDPNALPVAIAAQVMRGFVQPVTEQELVPLKQALGRVLASAVLCPFDVPNHDNSAMDGYAFSSGELYTANTTTLITVAKTLAGAAPKATPQAGQCVRIMTGAVMPAGCDTVIPQEFCTIDGARVSFPTTAVRAGDNRRLAAEDCQAGSVALYAGTLLRPAHLGLLASLGMGQVPVLRRLKVAFFSTGDELYAIGQPLPPGGVYDSNRYTLHAMLERLGVEVIDLGVVRDDPQALEAAFSAGCAQADAIVTSGGVSVGEADYTKQVMAKLGRVEFWRIAMRPGRPMAFGEIVQTQSDNQAPKRAVLFGLPGNPVAVMVTFYHFVRAALLRMQGISDAFASEPLYLKATSSAAIRKKPGRTEYQRGTVSRAFDGSYTVALTGAQGSGILRSMCEANGFIVLHHEQGNVAAGDAVDVLLFEGLV